MSANNAPFALGSSGLAANAATYSVNLGRQWMINGAMWRLLKAATAKTAAEARYSPFVSAVSGGLPTYVVDTTTGAGSYLGAGFGKSDQVALAAGDFFLGQTSGYGEATSAAAIAAGAMIGTSTTAGKIDDAGITAPLMMGISLESAAAADELVAIRIVNLC
jgi:hypothetical protein